MFFNGLRINNEYEFTNKRGKGQLRRNDLIYPDLCYKIIGILFDVYNELGAGYQEKYYQRAIASALKGSRLDFEREVCVPLEYRHESIGRYFLDFLVDGKIILEIKCGENFPCSNIKQIYAYLKATNMKLGILANFTKSGVKFKRIVNLIDNVTTK